MPEQQRLVYNELPEESIRLLKLAPGRVSDPLRGSLETFNLARCPPYKAVSYCWGSPDPAEYISCNDAFVKITPNLGSGLRRLRSRNRSRYLWADQVCIDQSNIDERSAQVNLMGHIFKNASSVITWLGEDDNEDPQASLAINLIEQLSSCKDDKAVQYEFGKLSAAHILTKHGLPPGPAPEWKAFKRLLDHAYFTRVWTVQEVRLASSRQILWGEASIQWEDLQNALEFLLRRRLFFDAYEPMLDTVPLVRARMMVSDLTTLEKHMRATPFRQAIDERDQVFAMLGLLEEVPDWLKADYSKSVAEVFAAATRLILLESGKISILGIAGTYNLGITPGVTDWPSWVPKWQLSIMRGTAQDKNEFRATGAEPMSWNIADDHPSELCISGLKIGTISDMVARQRWLRTNGTGAQNAIDYSVFEAWQLCLDHGKCQDPEQPLYKAFWQSVLFDGFHQRANVTKQEYINHGVKQLLAWFSVNYIGKIQNKLRTGRMKNMQEFLIMMEVARLALAMCTTPKEPKPRMNDAELQDGVQSIAHDFWQRLGSDEGKATTLPHTGQTIEAKNMDPQMPHTAIPGEPTHFHDAYNVPGFQHRFCITNDGVVCIAPGTTEPGDLVVVLFGSHVPSILRPVDDKSFQLVGHCFVDGFMDGTHIDQLRESGELDKVRTVFRLC